MNKFILTKLGGGKGYTLLDSDLWGLSSALTHLLANTNYFEGTNKEWAEAMAEKINELRHSDEEYE